MRSHQYIAIVLSLTLAVLPSCTKLTPEPEPEPELEPELEPDAYAFMYDLEYKVSALNTEYLIPVAHNNISSDILLDKLRGQAWKTTAIYQLNTEKEVVKEFVLITDDNSSISSARNETLPNYLVFSDDGKFVNFYILWGYGAYETDPFTYDASENAICLPLHIGFWNQRRLIYLSSETMVVVSTQGKDYKDRELVFMEILHRVSAAERQSWVDQCPHYGIRT